MYNNINPMSLLRQKPQAIAQIAGSRDYPNIRGSVRFFQTRTGVIVLADISGLPTGSGECKKPIFAMHIHGGGSCSGNATDPFADALTHYNPNDCPHPSHAGDMPPLFGCSGAALSAFMTDRFTVREVIGRTVIIHANPDDFTSQPAGNSGTKIACGVIRASR